jgi:hypothetical protein
MNVTNFFPFVLFTGFLGTWFGAALFYVVIVSASLTHDRKAGIGFLKTVRHGHESRFCIAAETAFVDNGVGQALMSCVHIAQRRKSFQHYV